MPPKNNDDQGDSPDKLNFSKTQLTVIVGSIAAIVVLALALGFFMKNNEAKLEEQKNVEAPPIEQATQMPLPDGAKKEELSKLEGTLPKQVPQTPAEELKQKAEQKVESASSAPAPAAPSKAAPAPVPVPAAPSKAAPAPAPGTIIEKTSSKPVANMEEKNVEPKEVKKAKHEKPKKKRVYARQRKAAQPLQKQVNVKKVNVAPKTEPRKEPTKTSDATVDDDKAGKLENKPGVLSFSTEIKPDTVPPAPATVEAPAKPAPIAPKVTDPKTDDTKVVEPVAAEPKFTLLAETVASEADAKSRVAALIKNGHQAYYLKKVTTKNTWYRVMTGTYATREEADAAAVAFGQKEHATVKVFPYEKP